MLKQQFHRRCTASHPWRRGSAVGRRVMPTSAATSGLKFNFTLEDAGTSPPSNNKTVLYAHCMCPYAERATFALLEKVEEDDTTAWFHFRLTSFYLSIIYLFIHSIFSGH